MKGGCMRQPWTFIGMSDFFPRLPIASVDGKQHLSKVVFSRSFIERKKTGSVSNMYTRDSQDILDSTNSYPDFMNAIITGKRSWVYGYNPEPVIFLIMKIRREHYTLPHSNAVCHQLTLLLPASTSSLLLTGRRIPIFFEVDFLHSFFPYDHTSPTVYILCHLI